MVLVSYRSDLWLYHDNFNFITKKLMKCCLLVLELKENITGQQDNFKHYLQHFSVYDVSDRVLLDYSHFCSSIYYSCFTVHICNFALACHCNLFAPRTLNYDFRNAKKKLMLPKPRTDYLKCSFSDSVIILWNNLPEEIRT